MGARAENACRHPALLPLPLPPAPGRGAPTEGVKIIFIWKIYIPFVQRSPAAGVAYELTDVSSVPVFRMFYCSVTTRFICLYM